jgi:hypothetical protein
MEVGALMRELEDWVEKLAEGAGRGDNPKDASGAISKARATSNAPVRTLAERLEAKSGAREAFDEMLLKDGFTDTTGHYIGGRKDKCKVLATWDATAEYFSLERFGTANKAQADEADALMDYLTGFEVSDRLQRLRNESPRSIYQRALRGARSYLKDSQ